VTSVAQSNPELTTVNLDPRHRAMLLDESAIPEDVVLERGYRSVGPADFDWLREQHLPPLAGLLITLHGTDGSNGRFVLRPDQPRLDEHGKPRKYEQYWGMPPILDVPRRSLGDLYNAEVDLHVTEGCRKGDAAAGQGYCTLVITGVTLWARRDKSKPTFDQSGEPVGLEPFEDLKPLIPSLDGRRVMLHFDSDYRRKPAVGLALRRLANWLIRQGALVFVVNYPDLPDGSKCGLDDYLAAYGPEALATLVADAEPWGSQAQVRQLHQQNRVLRATVSNMGAALHNTTMTPDERIVDAVAIAEFGSRASRGLATDPWRPTIDAPKNPETPEDGERVGLAADLGIGRNKVSQALDLFDQPGSPLLKETVDVRDDRGRLVRRRIELRLAPGCAGDMPGMLWQLAHLHGSRGQAATPKAAAQHPRPCPTHPEYKVLVRHRAYCTVDPDDLTDEWSELVRPSSPNPEPPTHGNSASVISGSLLTTGERVEPPLPPTYVSRTEIVHRLPMARCCERCQVGRAAPGSPWCRACEDDPKLWVART
jgi:hypothetical protein